MNGVALDDHNETGEKDQLHDLKVMTVMPYLNQRRREEFQLELDEDRLVS